MRDIKYCGQVTDTFVEVQVRCKNLCIPVHYRQSTDVHDTSGITKGDTQRPSGNDLRPGSFCPSFNTLPFLKGNNQFYAISIVFKCPYFIFWPSWRIFTKLPMNVVLSQATLPPKFQFPTIGNSSSAGARTCETEDARVASSSSSSSFYRAPGCTAAVWFIVLPLMFKLSPPVVSPRDPGLRSSSVLLTPGSTAASVAYCTI
jgi:hypothetical protein